MEDWALIRRLVADGVPARRVARELGVGRSTVARAVASGRPPKYERAAVSSAFTAFEPLVRQHLAAMPDMPATVIAERVGWSGSITGFRDNVRPLRPEHRPVDPADRLIWLPGDAAQCDLWFPPRKIPLEDGSKVLLPVAGEAFRGSLLKSRESLEASAIKMGMTRTAAKKYADQVLNIPAVQRTKFTTPGLEVAISEAGKLRAAILAIPNRNVSVSVATGVANKIAANRKDFGLAAGGPMPCPPGMDQVPLFEGVGQ